MKLDIKRELTARLLDLPHLEEGKSKFSKDVAFFCGKREIGHFHSATEIDVRLTRPLITRMDLLTSGDPRFVLGRKGSDWIAIRFKTAADATFIVKLFEAAVKANLKPHK